ncbi:MAG TPA: hypothetical protein VJM08_14280 [Anaerolineales bacterium]|nr:hypothetical protein [Anaerolineales bacterium]
MPTKLSIGGNIGVPVGPDTTVGVGVSVVVGKVCVVGVFVGNENVERGRGVFVGIALCGSASVVLTVDMAVSIISASLTVGVGWPLPQDASMAAKNKTVIVLPKMFILPLPLIFIRKRPTAGVCSKDVLSECPGIAVGGRDETTPL